MSLKAWKCPKCEEIFRTKNNAPMHCAGILAESVIGKPQSKFMEKTDAERGKTALVGQQKMLLERARKHSRDVDMVDLIETNNDETAYMSGWLTKDGIKRKAIDDL